MGTSIHICRSSEYFTGTSVVMLVEPNVCFGAYWQNIFLILLGREDLRNEQITAKL